MLKVEMEKGFWLLFWLSVWIMKMFVNKEEDHEVGEWRSSPTKKKDDEEEI